MITIDDEDDPTAFCFAEDQGCYLITIRGVCADLEIRAANAGVQAEMVGGTIGDDAYGAEDLVILSHGDAKFEIPRADLRAANERFFREWMEA